MRKGRTLSQKEIQQRRDAAKGRTPGALNRKTTGDLELHRMAFNLAWSRSKNRPKNLTAAQLAAITFHETCVVGALRGNDRFALISVERAFGRMPQPIEGSGGGPLVIEVQVSPQAPPA